MVRVSDDFPSLSQGPTVAGGLTWKLLVRDAQLQPVPGANVALSVRPPGSILFKVLLKGQTDNSGRATFRTTPEVPVEQVYLGASKTGYKSKVIKAFPAGDNVIDLLPETISKNNIQVVLKPAVPNVTVALHQKTDRRHIDSRQTDRNGRVIFPGVHPRIAYTVNFHAPGYQPVADAEIPIVNKDFVFNLKKMGEAPNWLSLRAHDEVGPVEATFLLLKDNPDTGSVVVLDRFNTRWDGHKDLVLKDALADWKYFRFMFPETQTHEAAYFAAPVNEKVFVRLKRKAVPSPPPPLAVQEKEAAKEPPLPEAAYRPADYTTVYIVGGIAAAGLIAYFLLK